MTTELAAAVLRVREARGDTAPPPLSAAALAAIRGLREVRP